MNILEIVSNYLNNLKNGTILKSEIYISLFIEREINTVFHRYTF